jgi:hypothetical protein
MRQLPVSQKTNAVSVPSPPPWPPVGHHGVQNLATRQPLHVSIAASLPCVCPHPVQMSRPRCTRHEVLFEMCQRRVLLARIEVRCARRNFAMARIHHRRQPGATLPTHRSTCSGPGYCWTNSTNLAIASRPPSIAFRSPPPAIASRRRPGKLQNLCTASACTASA